MERNISYVLSLVEARTNDNEKPDDNIPVPSVELKAKPILFIARLPGIIKKTSLLK